MKRTGRCLCGAVTYTAEFETTRLTACHCDFCRRWSSGPYFAVRAAALTLHDETHIKIFASSPWAERAFCVECGSSLFYRITADGPHQGTTHLAFGTLDDRIGFDLQVEWYIDNKPESYELAGERRTFTRAEVEALLAG